MKPETIAEIQKARAVFQAEIFELEEHAKIIAATMPDDDTTDAAKDGGRLLMMLEGLINTRRRKVAACDLLAPAIDFATIGTTINGRTYY